VLFEADQRGLDPCALAVERLGAVPGEGEGDGADYAAVIVAGTAANLPRIDEWLSTYSQGWPLERMAAVDRSIARMGAWEIVFAEDVPDPVVLDEAASLAAELSTARSPDFLSGLLGRLSDLKETLG
jgi:N utilization substance protein B